MKTCDVAVVGLGLIGSAALDALLAAGVDAVGLPPGSRQGSSHGTSRIFRRFNFENVNYTALSDDAFSGWKRIENESGSSVLIPMPLLEAGRAGSAMVAASRAHALASGGADPAWSPAQANREFAGFDLPGDWEVVVQGGAAILKADVALRVLRSRATHRVIQEKAQVNEASDGVILRSRTLTVFAPKVILALGPWMTHALPRLTPLLKVTRQVVAWFSPGRPAALPASGFPLFILERDPENVVYGFPDFEGRGIKAALHNHGPEVVADAWGPPPTDAELEPICASVAKLVPGAFGPIADRDVCLYTNTVSADRRPDNGQEFIIDRLPGSRIIVASACSGHGAKFAPAIGDRLARLAIDPSFEVEPAFQLSRFSCFA
jgi:sarcosine oxidase